MRGPAPSIVCPRCGLVAPPADGVGKFTTCLKCGLSFDAAPSERPASPTRRPPPAAEADAPVTKPRRGRALSPLQIVGVLLLLGVAGTLKYEYSWRTKPEREALEALERANRATHKARMQQIETLRAQPMPRTGVAACDRIMELIAGEPGCPDAAATKQVRTALDGALSSMASAASAEAGCTAALADVVAVRTRLGCK